MSLRDKIRRKSALNILIELFLVMNNRLKRILQQKKVERESKFEKNIQTYFQIIGTESIIISFVMLIITNMPPDSTLDIAYFFELLGMLFLISLIILIFIVFIGWTIFSDMYYDKDISQFLYSLRLGLFVQFVCSVSSVISYVLFVKVFSLVNIVHTIGYSGTHWLILVSSNFFIVLVGAFLLLGGLYLQIKKLFKKKHSKVGQ